MCLQALRCRNQPDSTFGTPNLAYRTESMKRSRFCVILGGFHTAPPMPFHLLPIKTNIGDFTISNKPALNKAAEIDGGQKVGGIPAEPVTLPSFRYRIQQSASFQYLWQSPQISTNSRQKQQQQQKTVHLALARRWSPNFARPGPGLTLQH